MNIRAYIAAPLLVFTIGFSFQVCSAHDGRPQALQAGQSHDFTLLFQTDRPWSPRTNINADTVLIYGIDDTVADRIKSWRDHGYHIAVMTGVAWGRYAPYLRGDFDGREHWKETQQEKSGKLRLHSGREVPYISPSPAYGRYLAQGVEVALDAGAEAIVLEEPEFWANTGWSESFKQSWQEFYHQPWQAPDSSADAQYRASKLKYFLYRRTLAQIFDAVKAYGKAHQRTIPCYVATHSLINYAQWQIVSPESSLLRVGADGYVAQVWTGTARTPNVYAGVTRQRTFETAFLEYGALQNIAYSSHKPIWYLDDPIEDNPNHSWTDYRRNWESTLLASLLQPQVARYEVLPWPDRIFGPKGLYPSTEPTPQNPRPPKIPIPQTYATELQTVFHALGEMHQPASATHWEMAGAQGIGVLVSDTLMFQRAAPHASDRYLGNFYGLALPLLKHGIPVESVQIESASGDDAAGFLSRYKVLLLTYEGQKPPTPEFHKNLTAWVKAGGVLIVVDNDRDPYNSATDWWNTNGNHFATPRESLFQTMGLSPNTLGLHPIGKGYVLYTPQSPSALSYNNSGSEAVMHVLQTAAGAIRLPLNETNALVLRRGPYIIAAGLDKELQNTSPRGTSESAPVTWKGEFINLFDPGLGESHTITIGRNTRGFFLDVSYFKSSAPRILAASAKITGEHATPNALTFDAAGIAETRAVVRILSQRFPRYITVGGKPLNSSAYQKNGRTFLIHFENVAAPQQVRIGF